MQASRLTVVIVAVALMATAGCSSRATPVGPRPTAATAGQNATGSGCGVLVFDLIPVMVNSRTARAYQNAIAGRGVALTDTEIQDSWYWIPLVGTALCTTLRGQVVQ